MSGDLKEFYTTYSDEIIAKRYESPYALRRYVHHAQYENILSFIEPGMKVLDAGCGEGVLSVMMAKKGAHVTGCDLSEPNVERCKEYAKEQGVSVDFLVGDGEALPFPDSSFDVVVSSHVLEHLPSFDKGLEEVMRVTKKRAIVAIPTVLNPCSWVQVGQGWFFLKGLRSFAALPWGFLKMLEALVTAEDGVDETYAGKGVPHVFRFPRILRNKSAARGYRIVAQEASSICLPYFETLLPVVRYLDKYKRSPVLRNFGYGTTYVIDK